MAAGGLEVRGLTVRFGSTTVVDGLDLEVPAGAWVCLRGGAGTGKSMALGAIAGLVRSTGTVTFDGRPLGDAAPPGIVLQEDPLLPLLSSTETVTLPLQVAGAKRAAIRAAAREALDAVGLGSAAHQLVGTLSGGQRQRVAIARALAAAPSLLLLDEPTAELDAANRAVVADLLRVEVERGAAVLVVTNDAAVLERSDRVLTLETGGRLATRG